MQEARRPKPRMRDIFILLCCALCPLLTSLSVNAQYITPRSVGAVSRDGEATATRFTTVLSSGGENHYSNAARYTDTLSIRGLLDVDEDDRNAVADLYVALYANGKFYNRTAKGGFARWDGRFATLQPTLSGVTLEDGLEIPVFSGKLGFKLDFRVYLAYRRHDSGNYVYTASATAFSIGDSSPLATAFHTPAPIVDELLRSRATDWNALSGAPADLQRFAFGPDGSDDIVALEDSDGDSLLGLTLSDGLAARSSASDELLLRTMFKFIAETGGGFRIVSTKHSNYALDSVGGTLVLRDYRSGYRDEADAGYLVFEYSGQTLRAVGRKQYDAASGEFLADDSWSASPLRVSGSSLALGGSATAMTLYAPPIDFDIPFDFNPDRRERVSNPEVTPQTKQQDGQSDPIEELPQQIESAYAAQVAASGNDGGTADAAAAMLARIESDLAAEGAALRYPAEFYLAFRAGLLSRILLSSDSTDGLVGQKTVPYVYFTNATDSQGAHHPFMVIASYGLPDSLALLWDVARPPGDGDGGGYDEQSVTRSYHREAFMTKIPLRDYGEVASLSENLMVSDLASDVGETQFDHHNYASVSATGMAIDGVVIYPSYNNSLHISQEAAELSAHGMHSGRGLGVHYHADAHSATHEGLNLYNDGDYEGHTHPPIVSIGFDGVAGYGIYRSGDTLSAGVNVPLDEFGGHEHDVYGYHYHSFASAETTTPGKGPNDPAGNVSYTAHKLPPLGAWAGRINDIPEFWRGPAPDYAGSKSAYLGNEP